jgi:hypothetical protein
MAGYERDDAPRPVVRVLGWIILACVTVGVLLGVSRRGEPLWADARALFVPGGVLMMLQSLLLGGRRGHPWTGIAPRPGLAAGIFVCGVGVLGLGLEHLDPPGAWRRSPSR